MVQNNYQQMIAQSNESTEAICNNPNSSSTSSLSINYSPSELIDQNNFNYSLQPSQAHFQNLSFYDRNSHFSNYYNCITRISHPKNNISNQSNFFTQTNLNNSKTKNSQFLQNIPSVSENLGNLNFQSKASKFRNSLHIYKLNKLVGRDIKASEIKY